MALLHKATINPTKLELLAAWLPTRAWFDAPAGAAPVRVAAARFDDPAGAVGIEVMLVSAGDGPVWHVPLTYRDAPLDGADAWLVGTTDHSVLGERWVYDAVGDPVYAAQVAAAIREAGHEAAEEFEVDGGREQRPSDLKLTGSGAAVPAHTVVTGVRDGEQPIIETDAGSLIVNRVPTVAVDPADTGVLTACWSGQETPVVLVRLG
ncbi:hypothetical protein [Actinoplanes sp. N902-109]|uniref:CG0192-related protein n=1 Tax=Actinoplanes sp. (strain N902-109) TaxID=649831 RepID=UPI0005A26641|nr:hypothetical protein [Actinoplanes sp. N902-109]